MTNRGGQAQNGDQVLERLFEEGVFDRWEPDVPNVVEEVSMAYSAAISRGNL